MFRVCAARRQEEKQMTERFQAFGAKGFKAVVIMLGLMWRGFRNFWLRLYCLGIAVCQSR